MKQERSFEGISLETPGSSSKSVLQMSRFQLCQECYSAASEAAAAVRFSPSFPLAISLQHQALLQCCILHSLQVLPQVTPRSSIKHNTAVLPPVLPASAATWGTCLSFAAAAPST